MIDFNPASARTSTRSADSIVAFVLQGESRSIGCSKPMPKRCAGGGEHALLPPIRCSSPWCRNMGRGSRITAACRLSFVAPLLAYLGAISTIVALRANATKLALVSSSLSIVGVITTAGFSLFPFLLPSSSHPDHSLTVWDASSSQATLTLMLFVVIVFLPIVLSYTAWAYRVFRGATSEAAIARGDDYAY